MLGNKKDKKGKPREGERYLNIHTKDICTVIDKIFFNVVYLYDSKPKDTNPQYCHYKTFQKHWLKVFDSSLCIVEQPEQEL